MRTGSNHEILSPHLAADTKVGLVFESDLERLSIVLNEIVVDSRPSSWPVWVFRGRLFKIRARSPTMRVTHWVHVDQPPFPPRTVLHSFKPKLLVDLVAQGYPLKLLRKLRPILFSHRCWSVGPASSTSTSSTPSASERPSAAKSTISAVEADPTRGKSKVSASTATHWTGDVE